MCYIHKLIGVHQHSEFVIQSPRVAQYYYVEGVYPPTHPVCMMATMPCIHLVINFYNLHVPLHSIYIATISPSNAMHSPSVVLGELVRSA